MAAASFTPQMIAFYKEHANDTLQPNEIATGVCGLVIAYTAVLARVWARRASASKFGWDDWLIAVSLIPLTGYAVAIFYSVSIGDGRHEIYITNAAGYIIAFIVQLICYSIAIALIKISILLFYHRIFPSRNLLWISYALGAIIIAYNLAIILVTTLQCIPLESMWTALSDRGHCINTTVPYATISVVNVLTDFVILALPIKYVWQLQMKTTRKLQILFMFLLGTIACVFGVVRVWSVATIIPVDQSWNDVYPEIWSFIEISMGVLAACLPTYGMLIKKAKSMSQQSRSRTQSNKPLQNNRWVKMRGLETTERSETDVQTSHWSKAYGPWSRTSQDHEHDLEDGRSPSHDQSSESSETPADYQRPDRIHVRHELRQSSDYEA